MVSEFADQKQRVAVCFSQWRKAKKELVEELQKSDSYQQASPQDKLQQLLDLNIWE